MQDLPRTERVSYMIRGVFATALNNHNAYYISDQWHMAT
jgi:hypothetical protein